MGNASVLINSFVAGGVGFEPTTTGLGDAFGIHLGARMDESSVDWTGFREYLNKKYRKVHADASFRYARLYFKQLENPILLETFNGYKRNNIMKALIALSKYLGIYESFKQKLKTYGIKWHRQNSLVAFLRIVGNHNGDVLEWYKKTSAVLSNNLRTYLNFALRTGLRRSEAIESFNLIISLSKDQKLNEYYNEELSALEHFRFSRTFLRNTKNAFVSILPKALIAEIAASEPLTYDIIRKRLQRRRIPTRINELRDYYGTFMVRHGLIREEVDLLQGRISSDIFVRHYWSPNFSELKTRVLRADTELSRLIA